MLHVAHQFCSVVIIVIAELQAQKVLFNTLEIWNKIYTTRAALRHRHGAQRRHFVGGAVVVIKGGEGP